MDIPTFEEALSAESPKEALPSLLHLLLLIIDGLKIGSNIVVVVVGNVVVVVVVVVVVGGLEVYTDTLT